MLLNWPAHPQKEIDLNRENRPNRCDRSDDSSAAENDGSGSADGKNLLETEFLVVIVVDEQVNRRLERRRKDTQPE